MQQAFLDHDGFQCGYCTPGQICSAVGDARRGRRGWPERGHRRTWTGDPGAARRRRSGERMSGNLCRCGAYANIVAGDRRRAARPDEALRLRRGRPTSPTAVRHRRRRRPDAVFLAGGTNLVDLMKLGVATPDTARRRPPAAARREIERRCPTAALRIGAAVRNSDLAADPLVRERYPVLAQALLAGRVRPAAQHGHHRRQPAAAHPLRLLPGRHHALQQARARHRAAGRRRLQPLPRRSSGASPSTASPPTPRTWRWRWPPSTPWCSVLGRRRRRARSRSPSCTGCPGDDPARDTVLEHGELITAVELPPLPAAARSPTARCATAPPTRSRWSRWPPRWTSRDGVSATSRIALGGVAHKPWRAHRGRGGAARRAPPPRSAFRAAAEAELAAAAPQPGLDGGNALQGPAAAPHARRRRCAT